MKRPSTRHLLLAVGLVAAIAAAAVVTVTVRNSESPVAALVGASADVVVPPQVALDVRSFGARGDGRADDTDALQAAISAGIGTPMGARGNPRRVLYLPAGTYVVTRPLEWRTSDGRWATGLTLQGQNRDRTVLRLADGATGFGDPNNPLPVLRTASRNAAPDGSGNQAFGNFLFDLTVSVGSGNPGADGVDYLANNRGAVRDVTFTAGPGSGHAGISMTRRWPGPCLFENITVSGFDHGVVVARSEYSVTFDGLDLEGQRKSGIDNSDNVLTVRGLTARSILGPVIRNQKGVYGPGLVTVVDSRMIGTGAAIPAIDNEGAAYLLRVRADGFSAAVRNHGQLVPSIPDIDEWSSNPIPASAPTRGRTPIAPSFPPDSTAGPDGWAGADAFGAVPDDRSDDTLAIQRALDSGKPVVYLRPGTYVVSRTLNVPPTIDEINGFDAVLDATQGRIDRTPNASVFRVEDNSPAAFLLANLSFIAPPGVVDVERPGSRPIHLRDIHHGGVPFRGGPGDVFLTDVEGGRGWTFNRGQRVWARQLNAEQKIPIKIRNNGAQLWILGLKTESGGTVIRGESGSATSIVGGLLYPVEPVPPDEAAFTSDRSSMTLTVAISASDPARSYSTVMTDDDRPPLRRDDLPRRGPGTVIPLYHND